MNEWGIVDDNGFIYTGTEDGMRRLYDSWSNFDDVPDRHGDLRLVEIHEVKK